MLACDILYGADGIAEFLFGHRKHRRKVYNLVETTRLPHFRLGATICALSIVGFPICASPQTCRTIWWDVNSPGPSLPKITP